MNKISKIILILKKNLLPRYDSYLNKVNSKGPFFVLISTILSQRTRDENTDKASRALFSEYKTPRQIAEAPLSRIKKLIKPSGFYKIKAKRVKEVSRIIHERYGDKVPDDYKELISLPGVGHKTADCTLVYGFGIPAIPVDTHVNRISKRLGWVDPGLREEEVREELKRIVAKKDWIVLNHLLVIFGQNICRPLRPLCSKCPIYDLCPFEGKSS